jgi:NAD(P)-dependent dehydrogenase (short-subunit alcohol dehydrogenase family)
MTPYTSAHTDPNGAGDTRPTAFQILSDTGMKGRLTGKVIVITGASSGIGINTARTLAATGATLFLTARDIKKAEIALEGILERGRVSIVHLDNNSLDSVRVASDTILNQSNNKVNILIENAGVMGLPKRILTDDGYEMQFQTNHLSHFLLFQLLKPALLASSTSELQSRVVLVSSTAHRSTMLLSSDNYSFERGNYDPQVAYANSKLANIYMANEIERRYGSRGLHGLSVSPGTIETNITRNLPPDVVAQVLSDPSVVKILKSSEQGAATTVLAAISKDWEGKGGKYLQDCKEAERGEDDGNAFGVGFVKQTYDPETEARLWKDSLKLVGISEDA